MQNRVRQIQINNFLCAREDLGKYSVTPLNCDASSRKYYRINLTDGSTRILMDDEMRCNHSKEFILIDQFLLKNGIRAPHIYAHNLRQGLMLLEDFGESDFVKKATPENEKQLLQKAVDVLIKLHQVKQRPACVKDMNEKVILDNLNESRKSTKTILFRIHRV